MHKSARREYQGLAMTRSLGDLYFKQPTSLSIAEPDIQIIPLTDKDILPWKSDVENSVSPPPRQLEGMSWGGSGFHWSRCVVLRVHVLSPDRRLCPVGFSEDLFHLTFVRVRTQVCVGGGAWRV